ncbi:hypothetical protein [Pedobacter aquatilis]|uniref:hypothetical protein n=1 Tax=Pedobacter aquatilis TaxID=351343 RepID=UPI00292D0046|nr:hypothetical protein [Pedobacter aquatilis]
MMKTNLNKIALIGRENQADLGYALQRTLTEEMVTYRHGRITIRKIGPALPSVDLWLQLILRDLPGAVSPALIFVVKENKYTHRPIAFNNSLRQTLLGHRIPNC